MGLMRVLCALQQTAASSPTLTTCFSKNAAVCPVLLLQGPGALSLFDLPTLQRLLAVREGRLVRQLGAAMRAATQVRVY